MGMFSWELFCFLRVFCWEFYVVSLGSFDDFTMF